MANLTQKGIREPFGNAFDPVGRMFYVASSIAKFPFGFVIQQLNLSEPEYVFVSIFI